jgi:hypothetical protein
MSTTKEEQFNFKEMTKSVPLKNRLKVCTEMSFINLIVELGYREDKMWTDDENELLGKLMKLANEHTGYILDTIAEWKADGSPQPKRYCPKCKGDQIMISSINGDLSCAYTDCQTKI